MQPGVGGLPTAIKAVLSARHGKGDVYAYDWAYRMVTATYDVTNPLSEVAVPGSQTYVKKQDFTLDGLGNRSQVQVTPWGGSASTTTYASDVVNQYTTIGTTSRTHDLNGNLTDDGSQKYIYDYKNRLCEVRDAANALIASYKYDALGRRIEKDIAAGATTRYILAGVSVIEEYDGSDTWQANYIHDDRIDHPVAMERADIADVDGDSNTAELMRFHYHQQALGSVTEMTSPAGAVVEWVRYDAYGKATIYDQNGAVVTKSAVGNPFLFTGRAWDDESGTYFYRARTYDPEAGRFLQRDPLGYVDGLSSVTYTRDAPACHTDPSGLLSRREWVKAHAQMRRAEERASAAEAEAQEAVQASREAHAAVAAARKALWEAEKFARTMYDLEKDLETEVGMCFRDGYHSPERSAWWEALLARIEALSAALDEAIAAASLADATARQARDSANRALQTARDARRRVTGNGGHGWSSYRLYALGSHKHIGAMYFAYDHEPWGIYRLGETTWGVFLGTGGDVSVWSAAAYVYRQDYGRPWQRVDIERVGDISGSTELES